MPTLTLLGAFKTLSHQLGLHNFPECQDAQALEAFLYVRAKIKTLKSTAELEVSSDEMSLRRCQEEFEFAELVLERLRSYIDLSRPLTPAEMVSAMSALQFLSRRLIVPFDDWDLERTQKSDLADLLVGRA